MSAFSNTSDNNGIVQQVRDFMRVDSNLWSTQKIANSCNNWFDKVAGYAISTDRQFQWDDTNHSKLPIGTTDLVANQSMYSFLADEQSNKIVTLTRIDVKDSNGNWTQLKLIDQADIDVALDEFESTTGVPKYYDKISDNIVKLYPASASNVTAGLKFYFQRTPSYFTASDTTKEPGVSPLLHRGFIIASAYDGALTLGLNNLQALSVELEKEEKKMIEYFSTRNSDTKGRLIPSADSNR
jgi:hypothetical protein